MDSREDKQFQVEVVNMPDTRLRKAKVMVCQIDYDRMHHHKKGRVYIVDDDADNRAFLRRFINIASRQKVDLLIFPELTVPSGFVDELWEFSKQYEMLIVAGTHYKDTGNGFLSICPIVTPYGVYNTEKITPSPFETSSLNGGVKGAIPGKVIKVFRGSKIGDFAVTICLDYTNDNLRNSINKDELDFLIVTAFNPKCEDFFFSMQTDVQRSAEGLYVCYSNAISDSLNVEGRSALFAFMDNCYKSEYKEEGLTDLNPPNKIYEFAKNKSYCIFEVDLAHKKPYTSKNEYTETNVRVIEEDNAQMDARYQFQKAIKSTDDKYLYIDKYYVKPKEYDEMCELLDKEHVLLITGDPGIGKTYTAIRILLEYYHQGYHPTWFYGMAKEDRDEQKEHLLNFEPQEKDVVYLEDPFGRTVFENREELKSLFANWVERFRACNAKLIITSRDEVFKQFEHEVLSGEKLEAFQKELNIRKPSYSLDDLKRIAKLYVKDLTCWANKKEYVKAIYYGINKGQLISPLMIYNLVMNHSRQTKLQVLKNAIVEAKNKDLLTQFADEIKILSHPAKILLYLILIYGKKNIARIRAMFAVVQASLYTKTQFEGSSFAFELKSQEGHRLQQLGEQIPVYRFSHPIYEEALIGLAEKDSLCALITETCLSSIIEEDSSMAADIFRRFVTSYPRFLEKIMIGVLKLDFNDLTETAKLDLTRRMLLSDYEVFQNAARKMYPMEVLIQSLYEEKEGQVFLLRLRMLNRRKEEIGNRIIEWERIFTKERISGLHPAAFLICYELAYGIDDHLITKIENNLQKSDVIRKFILLPTESQRDKLADILSTTLFRGIYDDLKSKIPEDIMGERKNKGIYVKILRKYILKKDAPKGEVCLDDGAMRAVARGAKIYPVGVLDVNGDFENGDIVYLTCKKMGLRVLSMVELSSDLIKKYKGYHSPEIYEMENMIFSTVLSRAYFREYVPLRFHRHDAR